MVKYLALYNGAADDVEKSEISDEQQQEFMNAWGAWAQSHSSALVDTGSPLFRKKRVTAEGSEDFTDSKTGYAMVEAESHEEAVQVFADHPHLTLSKGNWIDVLECPPTPS